MAESLTKNIFVIGASGRQGLAVVRHLRPPPGVSREEYPYHVYAFTRKPRSSSSKKLCDLPHVTVVKGDLNRPDTVRGVFEHAKETGGIWGMFVVLAFPGLGKNADEEELHGKYLADMALEYNVQCFIYSSVERGGEGQDHFAILDRAAKIRIERHIKSLTERGLRWTILRPAFFMENFEGVLGAVTAGIMKAGLRPTTSMQLCAIDDVGRTSLGVFQHPNAFRHQILVVLAELLTIAEQEEAYRNATGRDRPTLPRSIARALMAMNPHINDIVTEVDRIYDIQKDNIDNDARIQAGRKANPIISSFYSWCLQSVKKANERQSGWNDVSISKLILGRV